MGTTDLNDDPPFRSTLADEAELGPEAGRSALWRPLLWWIPIALGFLIWELTDETGIAVAVSCARAGWPYVSVGWWLYRHDPISRRGTASLVFHLGLGVTRWGLASIGLIWGLVFAEALWEQLAGVQNQNPAMDWRQLNLMLVGFCCLFAGTSVAGLGCAMCFRRGLRLWANPRLRRELSGRDTWPPAVSKRRRWLSFLFVTGTAAFGSVFVVQFLLFMGIGIAGGMVLAVLRAPAAFMQAFMVFNMQGSFVLAMCLGPVLGLSVLARTPEQCWPELIFLDLDADEAWEGQSERRRP